MLDNILLEWKGRVVMVTLTPQMMSDSTVFAINDLRNTNLERKLMIECGLNWDELTKIFKARLWASQVVKVLEGNAESAHPIKKR